MRRVHGSFLVMLAIAALAGACGLVIGLEPPQETQLPPLPLPPPPPPPVLDPCAHTSPPPLPSTDDDPTGEVPPFWLAVRTTRIGADGGVKGFDLDGVCTCDPSAGAARDGGPSCLPRKGATTACDEDGGVDNEAERLFRSAGAAFTDPNAGLAKDIAAGQKTILMYVAKYNGRKNDSAVSVGFVLSDGLLTDECDPSLALAPASGDAGPCEDGGYCTPTWRGCDRWHAAPNQVFVQAPGLPILPVRNGTGWVTNGVLVARGDVDVPFYINKSSLQITSPRFTARLEEAKRLSPSDPPRFHMRDALLAGRLPLDDLARVLFEGNFGGFYFCESPGIYQEVMRQACPRMDTSKASGLDYKGVVCDAISMGIPLEAELADVDPLARVVPSNTPNERCVDKAMPPLSETCPP